MSMDGCFCEIEFRQIYILSTTMCSFAKLRAAYIFSELKIDINFKMMATTKQSTSSQLITHSMRNRQYIHARISTSFMIRRESCVRNATASIWCARHRPYTEYTRIRTFTLLSWLSLLLLAAVAEELKFLHDFDHYISPFLVSSQPFVVSVLYIRLSLWVYF